MLPHRLGPAGAGKRRKKVAVSGAKVPRRVPYSSHGFAQVCTELHDRGQINAAQSQGLSTQRNPRKTSGFCKNAVFFSIYPSGETGIRTLGTREGTSVFKTGASSGLEGVRR
ncbi:MAG: hypothetical protein RLZZ458_2687 [Planctomycetota bacterium]